MINLGIGMVGYGFMGKVHTLSYKSVPFYYSPFPAKIKLVGVCTAHKETAEKATEESGYQFITTNYQELLKADDIQIINCCVPNYLHRDILIDSLMAGKHIYCDKPLCLNLKEAKEIIKVSQEEKLKCQMTFQYRFIPAIMRAKQLIDEGFLGKVLSFRGMYLHSGYIDPNRPLTWRLDKKKSGGGALFDLGSHLLDMIRYLLGDYESVHAIATTFVKERPLSKGSDRKGKVEVDDLALLQIKLKNGAIGSVEASRIATGSNDDLRLEIHGTSGAIKFNLMEPNWLEAYDNRDKGEPEGGNRGFKRVETVQRYPKPSVLLGPKFAIGWMRYHIASLHNFLTHILEDTPTSPNLYDGYKVQEIMEAAYLSAKEERWVKLPISLEQDDKVQAGT